MNRVISICIGFASLLAVVRPSQAADLPQPDAVLRKVFAKARASAASQRQCYIYTKETEIQDVDPGGRVLNRKTQVKTSRSRPIGPAEATRWSTSHGVNLDEELLDRYTLELAGRVTLRGRPTLEIRFSPNHPPSPVHHPLDRLLNRAMGTVWVDEEDYELAQADLRLTEPVNLSIIGAIDELSFRFERTRAADGSWLTTRTESNFRGRRLLNPVQSRHVTHYTGYTRTS